MILVLNLYLKLPFGKMDRRNPDVIHLANIIGRTPNAVALRLVNYASYDPQLQRRGIAGMAHGGKKCGEYWSEFINDRERLLFESERILAQLEGTTIEKKFERDIRDIPQGIVGETKVREVIIFSINSSNRNSDSRISSIFSFIFCCKGMQNKEAMQDYLHFPGNARDY